MSGLSTHKPIQTQHLFRSDFYEIKNWTFNVTDTDRPSEGYNDCFCIVLVRKGSFNIDLATQTYQMHTGHVVVEKANYDYRLRPATGECSIINFTATFYEQLLDEYGLRNSFFFANPNLLTLLLTTSPTIDYLHYQLISSTATVDTLEMDNLVLELVQQVVEHIENRVLANEVTVSLRKNHLRTVEEAKAFMQANFSLDFSLLVLADHCCVSPFHLSRIFKQFTTCSPYHYLLTLRLKHAEMLLRNASAPIADVCFSSGFNSIEHFATVFRKRYSLSPTQFRKQTENGRSSGM